VLYSRSENARMNAAAHPIEIVDANFKVTDPYMTNFIQLTGMFACGFGTAEYFSQAAMLEHKAGRDVPQEA
jgi:hypothetical protein